MNATIVQAIQDRQPELCALIIVNIHAQDIFPSGHVDSDCDIYNSFCGPAFAADMVVDGAHIYDSIDLLQRPLLPFSDKRHDPVRDAADGVV